MFDTKWAIFGFSLLGSPLMQSFVGIMKLRVHFRHSFLRVLGLRKLAIWVSCSWLFLQSITETFLSFEELCSKNLRVLAESVRSSFSRWITYSVFMRCKFLS